MKEVNKKGQMQLSFGMIFSIILIVIFIAFAFYAITKFLGIQQSIQVGSFVDDLQTDIDRMWKSNSGSAEVEYTLPGKIERVCFTDDDYENLVFRSEDYIEGKVLEHIDFASTLGDEEFLCIDNEGGKVKMILKKEYGENLVTITSQ